MIKSIKLLVFSPIFSYLRIILYSYIIVFFIYGSPISKDFGTIYIFGQDEFKVKLFVIWFFVYLAFLKINNHMEEFAELERVFRNSFEKK